MDRLSNLSKIMCLKMNSGLIAFCGALLPIAVLQTQWVYKMKKAGQGTVLGLVNGIFTFKRTHRWNC